MLNLGCCHYCYSYQGDSQVSFCFIAILQVVNLLYFIDVDRTDDSDSDKQSKPIGAAATRKTKIRSRLPSYRKSTASSRARKDGQGR